jgi:hypothetical protein
MKANPKWGVLRPCGQVLDGVIREESADTGPCRAVASRILRPVLCVGTERRYAFDDLVALWTARELRTAVIST